MTGEDVGIKSRCGHIGQCGQTLRRQHLGQTVPGGGQVGLDVVQGGGPVLQLCQLALAVADAAQGDQGHAKRLCDTQQGEGLHVHHLGLDGVIGGARDDIGPGRQGRGRHAGYRARQRQDGGQIQQRRAPLLEAQRTGVHVAIGNRRGLIDRRVLQVARPARAQGDDQVRQDVLGFQPRQSGGQGDGRLDRADAGHQRRDPRLKGGAVLRRRRHDGQDRQAIDVFGTPLAHAVRS
ncbi:hypothetical protein D3C86_1583570 [compost metagenome]